jgi:hypothetical protein
MSGRHPKWTRGDTKYRLPTSGTSIDVDGYKLGEPFGLIVCEECGRAAMDIDEVDHGRVNGGPCPNDPDV